MILLCGIPSEAPLRLVKEAGLRLGVPALLFNQRRSADLRIVYSFPVYPDPCDPHPSHCEPPPSHCERSEAISPPESANAPGDCFARTARNDESDAQTACNDNPYAQTARNDGPAGFLSLDGAEYPLAAINGAYVRLMDVPASDSQALALHQALVDWLEIAPWRVMNRLAPMGSNQSKPYQAQLIARAGFRIPPSLVTNDPQAVRDFLEQHGRVIYKSISAVRSIVGELDRPRLQALEKIRYLPALFQAFVPGDNIRVHVAGREVFATRIATPAVDYRYAGRAGLDINMEAVYIENDIAERCRQLAYLLELPLCGIDLKRTPAGEYYCFEANPSPAFSFYQEYTGQDIAAAIVRYLEFGE